MQTIGADDRREITRRKLNIAWIPLFQDVDEDAIGEILSGCKILLLPAGATLLKAGETNRNVYVLLSGEAVAHIDVSLGPDAGIRISKGEYLGELSAIDGKPASALVLAVTDTRVLVVPGKVFWDRLMVLPGIAKNLMVTLTERMRRTNDQAIKAKQQQLELIHIRKELDVARQLQTSMVPLQRPLFPERQDIELCGFMEPASDVGGDLFDAFFVDHRHLFLCIGDVSGHGIAAALFMARTIGLLHILAMNTLRPDEVLVSLNNRLCDGNDTNIFVTIFCAYLDLESGLLVYSNGGHCPPILSRGGQVELLAIPKGALVGAFSGMHYSSMEHELMPGETLFCYTDGVTEAQNGGGEEFTEDLCMAVLSRLGGLALPTLLDSIRQEVASFTCSNVLEDDCTMLALRRPAKPG